MSTTSTCPMVGYIARILSISKVFVWTKICWGVTSSPGDERARLIFAYLHIIFLISFEITYERLCLVLIISIRTGRKVS